MIRASETDCSKRYGYCCVVTGDMDLGHWESRDYLGIETTGQDVMDWAPTEGAHIIPFSYATWDPGQASQLNK